MLGSMRRLSHCKQDAGPDEQDDGAALVGLRFFYSIE